MVFAFDECVGECWISDVGDCSRRSSASLLHGMRFAQGEIDMKYCNSLQLLFISRSIKSVVVIYENVVSRHGLINTCKMRGLCLGTNELTHPRHHIDTRLCNTHVASHEFRSNGEELRFGDKPGPKHLRCQYLTCAMQSA